VNEKGTMTTTSHLIWSEVVYEGALSTIVETNNEDTCSGFTESECTSYATKDSHEATKTVRVKCEILKSKTT
jgi:hypothetical protein